MRTNQDEADYAKWLLELGNGSLQPPQNKKTQSSVVVPADSVCQDVVNEFFPDDFDGTDAGTHQRVILSPFNEDTRAMNERILDKLIGKNYINCEVS